jgi:broad specificity phosphatase PhoE
VPTIFFITHPDVVIDAAVPVSEWRLNERGRARMREMTAHPWASGVRRVFASSERKARDAAEVLADALRLAGYSVVDDLGENDRSATGYLPKQEFEATADAFYARPQESVRGWERAADAQARIVRAVDRIVSQTPAEGDVAIIGHGGTGTLLYCHLAGCRLTAAMTSRRRTEETGSLSTGRAENSCMTVGSRSPRQRKADEPVRPDRLADDRSARRCRR